MRLVINGKPQELTERRLTVAEYVAAHCPVQQVAIAVNGEIVRRDRWAETEIRDGDEVEVVRVVGGGDDARAAGDDALIIAGRRFLSRLFLGTGKYPDYAAMEEALRRSETEMVTVAVRYMQPGAPGEDVLQHIDLRRIQLLPNTAGATTAEQAVRMAHMAREATGTNWIKLEVIGDSGTLWPDTHATVEAAKRLLADGFIVLPYTSTDLVAALRLQEIGCATVMPLASPIGSGQGFQDWASIRRIIERCSVPVVVDAGIGTASDAAIAMELGADAVLVNTAIAKARHPGLMAEAMKWGVQAGRRAYLAGRIPKRADAEPSSPAAGVVRAPAPRTA